MTVRIRQTHGGLSGRPGPSEHVIPSQSEDWRGNLHRISDNPSSYRPFCPAVFRNSPTRNGTSIREIATTSVRTGLAMTGKSGARQNVSFRASPKTGVGISIGFLIIHRHTAPGGPSGGTDSPRHQVCGLVAPPSQVRGGKTAYRVRPRTMDRYRAGQGRNDYIYLPHDIPAAPATYNKTTPSGWCCTQ